MAPQCTALNVSDQERCVEVATSVNGLFCTFHSRQCQGLYRGYKIRNARLDSLEASPPVYLATSSTALANQNFADVESEEILHEIYDYLALKYALLDRVIRARKLHHSRFFSMTLDYGHQNYIDILSSRRSITVRALERLERRVGEVLYKKQKWFKWVRNCQEEEEAQRENEKKKVKKEAALFKRHMKDVQYRMKELRAKEDLKRQEDYLNEAFGENLMSQEEQEAEWDPIEDVIEDERGNYIDLIKHILLMTEAVHDDQEVKNEDTTTDVGTEDGSSNAAPVSKSSKKSKRAKQKALANGSTVTMPDKSAHDTKSQVRKRLREGVKLTYGKGMHIAGTIDNPVETHDKTAPIPDEEIDLLLEDMSEIKNLLFCRLLLSHATVLPAAIRANSIHEFLSDKEVTDSDLRDLALKLDNPGLQEIRDACADLGRGEEEEDDDYGDPEEELEVDTTVSRLKKLGMSETRPSCRGLPDTWAPEREKQVTKERQERQSLIDQSSGGPTEEKGNVMIDFGEIDDEGMFKSKKMSVKLCGRYIYNYPSERAITRGGWLQFCLIAKDSHLHDAIKLCRHWDEFFDLNILANFQFFPAANWLVWKGDRTRQQLLQMGFIPYFQFEDAEELSKKTQTGSRGQARRAHNVKEVRNFICANIKRNDPATRRFLQYLSMQSSRIVVLIRDAKTAKILRSPPDEELWLSREKSGLGRASKNEWIIGSKVGPKFFEQMESERKWHFGFNEYYDVYIWDLEPGQPWPCLYNAIYETLFKAHRFSSMKDLYSLAAPTLRTLTRDPVTFRTREIKLGQQVISIWDEIQRGRSHMLNPQGNTPEAQLAEDPHASKFYNEADVLEDVILFPEELSEESSKVLYRGKSNALYSGKTNALEDFVSTGPDWYRFVNDLDTDEELEDSEYSDDEDGSLIEDENEDQATVEMSSEGSSGEPSSQEIVPCSPVFPEEEMKDLAVLRGWKFPERFRKDNMETEFLTFMDREKSKAFKRSWHAADLHHGAHERQREKETVVKQMEKFNNSTVNKFKYFHILRFLDVHPDRNRRVVADMREARSMATLFFPSEFLKSEFGILHKDSLLLNQLERARNPPKRRPHTSNQFQPQSFWEEWDSYWEGRHRNAPYPTEWDIAIRPIIAKLYKAGVIGNAYLPDAPGRAMAVKRPSGDRDLCIDLRVLQDDITFPRETQRPPSKENFLLTARRFSKDNPGARFAALRLWTAPHFYPLMIGHDRRYFQSFTDALGRAWEWNFVPKDMPHSETSIHHTASLRLRPFKHLLGHRVTIRRDLFLVMGTNEDDLLKFTTAAIFAIQTEPWRLEVDLWRSFINVDLEFLDMLEAEWLD